MFPVTRDAPFEDSLEDYKPGRPLKEVPTLLWNAQERPSFLRQIRCWREGS